MSKDVLIQVCLPKDGDDDSRVEVGLNGNMMVILRGAEVSVSPAVYEILVNAGLIPADPNRKLKVDKASTAAGEIKMAKVEMMAMEAGGEV